jgi:hypothetical protein
MTADIITIDALKARQTALDGLHDWDESIVSLSVALADAATARDRLSQLADELSLAEARIVLSVEGRNEAERKANLTIALAEHEPYRALIAEQRRRRLALADAERRIAVSKESCRLLRAAVALGAAVAGEENER